MNTGIYKIENLINGDLYIGQSASLVKRMDGHWRALRGNTHGNKHLQGAWNKYGETSFAFKMLLYCEVFELTRYEQKLVDILDPAYNIRKECVNSQLGLKHSKETIQKMIVAKTKEKHPNFGRHLTEEQKRKLSEVNKGIKSPRFGKHHTEETKRKLSMIQKEKRRVYLIEHPKPIKIIAPNEDDKKILEFNIKLLASDEHKKKLSEIYTAKWIVAIKNASLNHKI